MSAPLRLRLALVALVATIQVVSVAAVLMVQNGVAERIHVWRGELDSTAAETGQATWDIVVANILAPVIIRLLGESGLLGAVAPDGYLILSGIIDEQGPDVEAALAAAGGQVRRIISAGDWVTYVAGHRQ